MFAKLSIFEAESAPGINHRVNTYDDISISQALALLRELKNGGDQLHIKTDHAAIEYCIDSDNRFSVDIYDIRNNFWAISEINTQAGDEIMRIAFADKEFGDTIPTTTELWGAYGANEQPSKE